MAGRRKAEQVPSRALVASAVAYQGGESVGEIPRIYRPMEEWQKDAWRFYDITGELRFAANWISNVLSRAEIGVAKRDGSPASPAAVAARDALFVNSAGQAAVLAAMGVHLTIAGEAYLVGRADKNTWEIVGTHEMRVQGGSWAIDYGIAGQLPVQLGASDVVIRIWRPHPYKRIEADSPIKALIPVLTELEYLTRHVFAQVTSRLAGAGILFLPQGFQFPPSPDQPEGANTPSQFIKVLGDNMMAPIKNPSSPSALVPIVVTVPDDLTEKPHLMRFWSDLDQHAIEMRSEAIRRFALGMDLPAEIVLGMSSMGARSGASHWTAWQIDEASIKVHIEPLLQVVCDALTAGYLRKSPGVQADEVFTFDTSSIRLRPDRSKEAFELYDRGELDGQALRRETGFEEADLPDDAERKLILLRKVASGSATPEMVADALKQLGVDVGAGGDQMNQARPAPSLLDHPVNEIPSDRNAVNLACEVMVYRTLERAGNRLRSASGVKVPDVCAADTHLHVKATPVQVAGLLADAWDVVPKVLSGADAETVTARLDEYCRLLLVQQQAHDPALMRQFLWGSKVLA